MESAIDVAPENRRLPEECERNWFTSPSDAIRKIETWVQDYNQQRPRVVYSSLSKLARTRGEIRT